MISKNFVFEKFSPCELLINMESACAQFHQKTLNKGPPRIQKPKKSLGNLEFVSERAAQLLSRKLSNFHLKLIVILNLS